MTFTSSSISPLRRQWLIVVGLSMGAVACGGGGSNSLTTPPTTTPPTTTPPAATVYTGVFVDAAVAGLNFRTATQTGITNENGEFSYQENEEVIFSIGAIDLPSVLAKAMLSPLDIFATEDFYDIGVVNLSRLLQTLDDDGIPGNGIRLNENVHTLAAGLNVDFTAVDFAVQVDTLVANGSNTNTMLISAESAVNHLMITLENGMPPTTGCGTDHAKVGYSGELATLAHNVAGTVTVVNNCTLEVSMFNYDGGGPLVYFYGSTDHGYNSDAAFAMGNLLNGRVYQQETLMINLPAGKTLDDFNSLSVWCADFNVSFGQTLLSAP
ncbi:DM13 domain-containing protein [Alteromonadaceae bacterium BrNp21-10]|nr:DM13 domain-containing protein [Alteromonadaceae bacterium BrNp21-10]